MAGFGSRPDAANPNPAFFIDQAGGVCRQCLQHATRLQTIVRMYPDAPPVIDDWAPLGYALASTLKVYLAPTSDTEDPYGGEVPLHERVQFSTWFAEHPAIANAISTIWDLRPRLLDAFGYLKRDRSCSNQEQFRLAFLALEAPVAVLQEELRAIYTAGRSNAPEDVTPQPEVKDAVDVFVTLEDLKRLTRVGIGTMRNKHLLPPADHEGGGRGNKSKWSYLRVKPILESKLNIELPDLAEAKRIISAK